MALLSSCGNNTSRQLAGFCTLGPCKTWICIGLGLPIWHVKTTIYGILYNVLFASVHTVIVAKPTQKIRQVVLSQNKTCKFLGLGKSDLCFSGDSFFFFFCVG